MGTTFQAQVEVFFAANREKMTCDSWQAISRWEFQKDYSFSMSWSDVSNRGWPEDVGYIIGESLPDPKYGYDFDSMQWGTGELFALLEPDEAWPWFVEAREHVKRLLALGYKVRVLTWGE